MPRKLRARPGNKPLRKKTNSEPLAEGIREQRPWGFFKKMSDDELIEYAENSIKKKEIKNRGRLRKEDGGLYQTLLKRKLLDRLEFELKKRMTKDWASLNNNELIEYTKNFIKKKKIKSRSGLQKEDKGLYSALRRRKLLDRLEFEGDERAWRRYSSDKLVDYAKNFMKKKKIKSREGLKKEDGGLYSALRKRKLLDSLEFEEGRRPRGFFKKMSDDELVEFAKRLIENKGIKSKYELEDEDGGLYYTLLRRKLLDRLEFEEGNRDWAPMSDDELVGFADNFVKKKKIKSRSGLQKEDGGLYQALLKRKLLNRVFSPLEKTKEKQAVQDVFDALREFGGPG